MGAGIVSFAVTEVQRKLNDKNKALEQAVERSTIALHQQEQELSRALEIQRDLLPKELPQPPGIELAGAWQPARAVGGDYFDVILLDDRRLGICVGDVSGKGLTAALLSLAQTADGVASGIA
jgi:serine phosphatase RsbU (regulator of sigma subunit)